MAHDRLRNRLAISMDTPTISGLKGARIPISPAGIAAIVLFCLSPAEPGLLAESPRESRAVPGGSQIVTFVIAEPSSMATGLELPAALQAFQDTPIYARTTGYILKWLADIGDRVKSGQTLAVIDGPDLDQQLNQARANLGQAKANLEIARISADRWKELGAQHAVAQQDVDQKTADFAARNADVSAAQANVDRLTQLKDYQNVTAPYDGVVTARNAQVGALISPGAGVEIYHIAQTDVLRIYANVPQRYVRSISPGLPVEVLIPEFPNETFHGKVVRFAGALDNASRTLLTEVQIPNADGKLFPGMFGQVRFKLAGVEPAILLPSDAAIIRAEGTLVATIDTGNRIRLVHVRLGRDFGTEIEILGGIARGTRVVSNPRDSLTDGLLVEPVAAPEAKKG
jgi:RND family efflux transporter MFP subunit